MLAASAARGGIPVAAIDGFADRDTRELTAGRVRRVALDAAWEFPLRPLLGAIDALEREHAPRGFAGCVLGTGFEGAPETLRALAQRLPLLGNPPPTVALLKDPGAFATLLDALALPHPQTRLAPPTDAGGWLVKRSGGAGGWHVARWRPGAAVAPGDYFQRAESGDSSSALFLADGRRARIIGFNRQLHLAFGDRPFCHLGLVGRARVRHARAVESAVFALTRAGGLRGLGSLDFLDRPEGISILEVNPRPSASVELYDADFAPGLFALHLRACAGELPDFAAGSRSRGARVVHAWRATAIPADAAFPAWCVDRPAPGTRVAAGQPLCTVTAEAATPEASEALLAARHDKINHWLRCGPAQEVDR